MKKFFDYLNLFFGLTMPPLAVLAIAKSWGEPFSLGNFWLVLMIPYGLYLLVRSGFVEFKVTSN